MEIKKVTDPEFAAYGKVLEGYDFSGLVKTLEDKTPLPEGVVYVGSCPELEYTDAFGVVQNNVYGGMPVQIGYCNGHNTKLNCLEYHRDSEINIGSRDFILLLAKEDEIINGRLDTSKVKAFLVKAGQAVEVYATTLHYAPCSAKAGEGFKTIVVLPKGTNGPVPGITVKNEEDKWMTACNKWLLAHAEAAEAKDGAYVGLDGVNIDIAGDI
jgi:ureidoglycolate hydrolase